MALLVDVGKVLRACAIGIEGRERLLNVCVYLPSSKDLVVLAALDDKLMDIFVWIAQKKPISWGNSHMHPVSQCLFRASAQTLPS